MPRTLDQRYVPTDVRSQIIHFLWSIGFALKETRDEVTDHILHELETHREWLRICESANETNSSSASPGEH
jgi:hypothetical protein